MSGGLCPLFYAPMSDATSDYLNQIGKIPLLTAAEEIELGNAVQRMMPLLKKQDLTKEEKKIIRIGERAKRRMIQGNLRLVVGVAGKFNRFTNRLTIQDLIQEGNIGLIRAVEMFDPTRGYKFSTYAYWWIRQGIIRASQVQDRVIKLPSGASDALRKIQKFSLEYMREHNKPPTIEQCAELIGMQPKTVRDYLQNAFDVTSLDAKARNKSEECSSIIDLIPDQEENPEDELLLETQIQAIRQAINQLGGQKKEILTMYYGLDGEQPLSSPRIGKKLGMGRELVRKHVLSAEQDMKAILQGEPPGKQKRQVSSSSLNWGWG